MREPAQVSGARVREIRRAQSVEELMPDEDRRGVALAGLAIVVENAERIYPDISDPGGMRYVDVLRLFSHGLTRGSAARALGVTPDTVMKHLAKAHKGLGAKNTTNAVAIAIRRGLIE